VDGRELFEVQNAAGLVCKAGLRAEPSSVSAWPGRWSALTAAVRSLVFARRWSPGSRPDDHSPLGQLRVTTEELWQLGNAYVRLVRLGEEAVKGLVREHEVAVGFGHAARLRGGRVEHEGGYGRALEVCDVADEGFLPSRESPASLGGGASGENSVRMWIRLWDRSWRDVPCAR